MHNNEVKTTLTFKNMKKLLLFGLIISEANKPVWGTCPD